MSNVIPLKQDQNSTDLEMAMKVATIAQKARLVPADVDSVEKAQYIAITGHALGLHPAIALNNIFINKKSGRLGLSLDLAKSLVRRAGYSWKLLKHSDKECEIEGTRDGETQAVLCTWGEIETAGLTKPSQSGYPSTYTKYPRDMIYAFTLRRLFSRMFSDIMMGFKAYDEREPVGEEDAPQLPETRTPSAGVDKVNALVAKTESKSAAQVFDSTQRDPSSDNVKSMTSIAQIENPPPAAPSAKAQAAADTLEHSALQPTQVEVIDQETGEIVDARTTQHAEPFDYEKHKWIVNDLFAALGIQPRWRNNNRTELRKHLEFRCPPATHEAIRAEMEAFAKDRPWK